MKIKSLFNVINFAIYSSFVLANEQQVTGDCKEIENYLIKKSINFNNVIPECIVNDNGNLTELTLILNNDYNLSEEDIQKFLSYNTINKLNYKIYYDNTNSGSGYMDFSKSISDLKNLKELNLMYNNYQDTEKSEFRHGFINKNVLKASNIQKLTINGIKFNQPNINEIANLKNLEELNFYNCDFDLTYVSIKEIFHFLNTDIELHFDKMKSLNKLSSLTISYDNTGHIINKNIFKAFKTIEKLILYNVKVSQDNIDDIKSLTHLKELYINKCIFDKKINFYSLKKFKELEVLDINYNYISNEYNEDTIKEIKFEAPKSLKKLYLDGINLSQENVKNITDITNLEEIYLDCHYDNSTSFNSLVNLKNLSVFNYYNNEEITEYSLPKNLNKFIFNGGKLSQNNIDAISKLTNLQELTLKMVININELNFDSLKSLKKLSNLNIQGDDSDEDKLEAIPEFVYSLNSLKKLSLPYNNINIISDQIKNIKNLEYLDLNNNKITNIPKVLGNHKNMEYLDLSYNSIYDELPESFNNLTKLKYINLENNLDIKGKTLTNKDLEYCIYDYNYSLCKAKDINCLKNNSYNFKDCDSSSSFSNKNNNENKKATVIDECSEIYNYFLKKVSNEDFFTVKNCISNNKGKVTTLEIEDTDLSKKDYKKLSTYNTIKSLKLQGLNITQTILDDITGLTNLEELNLEGNFVDVKFDGLKKLKNLSVLSLYSYNESNIDFKVPKSLKKLYLYNMIITQDNIKEIASLTNLKELSFTSCNTENNLNINSLKKLLKIENLEIKNSFLSQNIDFIYAFKNLKNLIISNYESMSIFNQINKFKQLESLVLENCNIDTIPDSLLQLKNLKKLNLHNNKISNFEKLINLKNLEDIDLSLNDITTVPEKIDNLEKLNNINLSFNNITDIPKQLNNIKNFENL
ncbi:L domain-like protein [Anaeromyces robustus]|uniref:L domain-like protein n=1 Tax=Anaeromyces robustus TaxID=1754192 RepID=A0A1Y1XGJ9_9FUNG|nr:L domain-like protein [Anaeromyces robustus]|eukprot:ORX84888.1 L domain-like protein [Anaeromyces robustus]